MKALTKKELINKLQNLDDDAIIQATGDSDTGCFDVIDAIQVNDSLIILKVDIDI